MKLKYIGESFGAASLTDGQTYIATVSDVGYYRVFDDSGEDYMYFQNNPRGSFTRKLKERQRPLKETRCLMRRLKYVRNTQ